MCGSTLFKKKTGIARQAVSSEEVFKRRAELAKMRTLLFKHEAKARHLAKIKSKDYHRRLKKAARRKVLIFCSPNP